MKICRETRGLMERAFDGRITVDEEFRLEEHTQTCAQCARDYEESSELHEALLAMPAPPIDRLDLERSLAAIHAGIDANEKKPIAPKRPWVGFAAAAAVLGGLGFGMWSLAGSDSVAPGAPGVPGPIVKEHAAPVEADVAALPEVTDYDSTRHQRALEEVRSILVSAAGSANSTEEIDGLSADLAAEDWPVVRLIERFVMDENVIVARVATIYLGQRGDGTSASVLAGALQRRELELDAARALVGLGTIALDSLASAVWNPQLTAIVLDGVREQDSRVASAWIERTLQRARSRAGSAQEMEIANEMLPLLTNCDLVGAETLLRLTEHKWIDTERVLDALALTPGAVELIDDEWLADHSEVDTAVLLGATQRLHGPRSLTPVVDLCRRSRRYRSQAFNVLATYDGTAPVQALLTLGLSARMPEEDFLPAWRAAVDHDADRMYQLASKWPDRGDGGALRNFLHWLIVSERIAVVPSIIELLRSPLLLPDDRERALIAISEFGGIEHVAGVRDLFIGLEGRESKIAAACVYAVHVLGGDAAVTRMLSEASTRTLDDVRRVFSQPGATRRPGTTLFRLARELEPLLQARDNALSRTQL